MTLAEAAATRDGCKISPWFVGSQTLDIDTDARGLMNLALTILALVFVTNILQWTGHALILDAVRSSLFILPSATP